jgi:hypothetical protein
MTNPLEQASGSEIPRCACDSTEHLTDDCPEIKIKEHEIFITDAINSTPLATSPQVKPPLDGIIDLTDFPGNNTLKPLWIIPEGGEPDTSDLLSQLRRALTERLPVNKNVIGWGDTPEKYRDLESLTKGGRCMFCNMYNGEHAPGCLIVAFKDSGKPDLTQPFAPDTAEEPADPNHTDYRILLPKIINSPYKFEKIEDKYAINTRYLCTGKADCPVHDGACALKAQEDSLTFSNMVYCTGEPDCPIHHGNCFTNKT